MIKMATKDWKKARSREGTGTSIIYKKGKYFLEIFADSSWKNDNHNVIIYDSSVSSYSSSLGTVDVVKYFLTKREAKNYAESYMKTH